MLNKLVCVGNHKLEIEGCQLSGGVQFTKDPDADVPFIT